VNDLLLLGLLGLGIGGFYGLLACGIVVGHKGSGLINLDQGALAMYPAYAFATMRESGDLFLPWFDFIPGPIDIPYSISIADGGTGKLPALLAALAMSVLLGLIVQTLVFGPLRHKPPISKIIGSLGALIYLTSVATFQFGAAGRTVDGVLPSGAWEDPFGLGGRVPWDRVTLAAIAVLVGAGLALYYRLSRSGLATRAVEENEIGASLLGFSPTRVATVNWLISTTITGMAGVLALDFLSLTPTRYTLAVVPALGAALLGGLTSPWRAALGGVALGVTQQAAAGLTLEDWWPDVLPQSGVRQAVPLIVIIIIQFMRGHTLPVRSTQLTQHQPKAPIPTAWRGQIIGVVGVAAVVLLQDSRVSEGKLVTTMIGTLLMLSSLVLIGYLGQISLATMAFAGVAAYLATKFASDGTAFGASPFSVDGPGLPDPLAVALGIACAVAIGCLIALPALRIRGLQLAVVTLAASVAATELILGNQALMGRGARANVSVPPPEWFGVSVGPNQSTGGASRLALALFTLGWLVAIIAAVVGIRRGATGRRFLAVRANERAAEAAGVSVVGTKMLGFSMASAIAGLAGALTAYHHTVLQISTFSALAGIANVSLLFLGGVGRIGGALLGGALVPGGILSSTSSSGEILRSAVSGMAMIAIAVFRSDGLVSLADPITTAAHRRLKSRR
jgi:branched-chain amino acid transport system permease protein